MSALRRWAMAGIVAGALGMMGCGNNASEDTRCAESPDIAGSTVTLHIERLEDSLVHCTSAAALASFFDRHRALRDIFFNRATYSSDSAFAHAICVRFGHPGMDTLWRDTHRVFGDLTALKEQLQESFSRMKSYYPAFEPPRVQTIISGFENDLYMSDTLIVIGLDYFIGPTAKYRPNMYAYLLRRYQESFIAPSLFLLLGIDPRYNKMAPRDKTMLADMIAYGKAYYFAKAMLPCTPDSVLIGYSAKELAGSQAYSNLIWKRLVGDEALYSTDHQVKQKYLGERPKTLEVGPECPGRIGAWVGWQIVAAYMKKHSNITLPQLMATADAGYIFRESGYRPQ